MLILKLVALLAFLFIPGYLVISLFLGKKSGMSGGERLFLSAVLGCGLVALLAMVIGLAGRFGFSTLIPAWVILCAALLYFARRRITWIATVGWRQWAILALLAAAGLALFLPPGRVVFGWNDDGVYPNIAAQMVERGEIHTRLELVTEVSPEERNLVFAPAEYQDSPYEGYLYKPYFITSFSTGEVVPRFYYLWPSCMAVFGLFLGLENMFYAITLMAVLSVIGIYLLAGRMLGRRWAWVAAILALLSPLMIFFSRYTTSEMLASSLFIAAALSLLSYREGGGNGEETREAIVSSIFLTLAFLVRIDFCLVLLPLLAVYFMELVRGKWRSADGWMIAATVSGFILASLVGWLFSAPYFYTLTISLFRYKVLIIILCLMAIGAVMLIFRRGIQRFVDWFAARRKVWVTAVWLSLAAAFLFFYFIRPTFGDRVIFYGMLSSSQGLTFQPQTLIRWGWYFSAPGLLLLFAGYAGAFTSKRRYSWMPLTVTGLFVSFFYMWNMHCNPLQIMVMRRIMPVIFPLAIVMIVNALRGIFHCSSRISRPAWRSAGMIVAGLALSYLVLFSATRSWPILGLREGGNQQEVVEAVHEAAAEGTVLIDFNAGDLFGPPLLAFYGQRNAWLMHNSDLTEERFAALLGELGFPDKPVYLLWRPLLSGEVPDPVKALQLQEVGVVTWRQRSLEASYERRPESAFEIEEDFILYRITP
jgi:hypothetical protein